MKLIFVIVHDEDSENVAGELTRYGYSVTKLCSTGGFLRTGNTTMMIGLEDEELERVLGIIKTNSQSRKQFIKSPPRGAFMGGMTAGGIEVTVGGATAFIMPVERMEKY